MIPFHDHSTEKDLNRILAALETGQSVALISDAGTPLISDPGYRLVREARNRGVKVIPVPGCCAAITALSAAGIPCNHFTFEGFLPAREGGRIKALEALARETRTMVFYEAPHRILKTLENMAKVWGEQREAVIARELTKTHETFVGGTLGHLVSAVKADANQQRGEIVVVVAGAPAAELAGDDKEQHRVLSILLAELSVKQAASLTAKLTGGNKRALYNLAVELKSG